MMSGWMKPLLLGLNLRLPDASCLMEMVVLRNNPGNLYEQSVGPSG